MRLHDFWWLIRAEEPDRTVSEPNGNARAAGNRGGHWRASIEREALAFELSLLKAFAASVLARRFCCYAA
ncbi:MAG: hypothetical protein AAF563_05500 [Pseudomonadota bacterium]